jgi:hypothetical protein
MLEEYEITDTEPKDSDVACAHIRADSHVEAAEKYLQRLADECELEEDTFTLWVRRLSGANDAPWVEIEADAWLHWHISANEVTE